MFLALMLLFFMLGHPVIGLLCLACFLLIDCGN